MKWRYRLYSLLQMIWLFVAAGAFFVVDAGIADPYVPSSLLPSSRGTTAIAAVGLAFAGIVGFGRLRLRAWRSIGRQAGLSTDGSTIGPLGLLSSRSIEGSLFELFPEPDLTGAVDGRDVRVHTHTVSKGGGGDTGGTSQSYTLVEAKLDQSVEGGLMLGRGDAGSSEELTDVVPGRLETMAVGDGVVAVGADSEADARNLISGAAREALLAVDESESVVVGDPTDALVSAIPDEMEAVVGLIPGGGLESKLRDHPPFDPETVAINAKGQTLDPATLERKIRAVTAVADSVERAEAATPRV